MKEDEGDNKDIHVAQKVAMTYLLYNRHQKSFRLLSEKDMDVTNQIIPPLTFHDIPERDCEGQSTKILMQMVRCYQSSTKRDLLRSGEHHTAVTLSSEILQQMVDGGASLCAKAENGFSVLHEAIRSWDFETVDWIISQQAQVNVTDKFGWTPLHVAVATGRTDVVQLLLKLGAKCDIATNEEKQLPLHYAARTNHDAAIRMLLDKNRDVIESRDCKRRTPLQLAAEYGSIRSARILLRSGASAVVSDSYGQRAISWMVRKMPKVAEIALDQLESSDNILKEKQYDLTTLLKDQCGPGENLEEELSVLELIVQKRDLDLIMHPTVKALISHKWNKNHATILSIVSFLVAVTRAGAWSAFGCLKRPTEMVDYEFTTIADTVRVIALTIMVLCWVGSVFNELQELIASIKERTDYRIKRKHIIKDLKYMNREKKAKQSKYSFGFGKDDDDDSHDEKLGKNVKGVKSNRWQMDLTFYKKELEYNINKLKIDYMNDVWNAYDLVVIMVSAATFFVMFHALDEASLQSSRHLIRAIALTSALQWVMCLKHWRVLELWNLGAFVVMLGEIAKDMGRFTLMYGVFFLAFGFPAFMLFGGGWHFTEAERALALQGNTTLIGLPGVGHHSVFGNVNDMLFELYLMTLGQDYDLDSMKELDFVGANMFTVLWTYISTVTLFNLLIALMSNTFQRVYDNAKAISKLQCATKVVAMEDRSGFQSDVIGWLTKKCCCFFCRCHKVHATSANGPVNSAASYETSKVIFSKDMDVNDFGQDEDEYEKAAIQVLEKVTNFQESFDDFRIRVNAKLQIQDPSTGQSGVTGMLSQKIAPFGASGATSAGSTAGDFPDTDATEYGHDDAALREMLSKSFDKMKAKWIDKVLTNMKSMETRIASSEALEKKRAKVPRRVPALSSFIEDTSSDIEDLRSKAEINRIK